MVKRADFSAVIFDMDGLVLDSESTYRSAWREAAQAMEYEFSDSLWTTLSGMPSEKVMAALKNHGGAGFDLSEFTRLSALCWRRHVAVHGIGVKQGFYQLLELLIQENIPYCLATNSQAANAYECLELAGLENTFSMIISRDQVQRGKPAPDLFLKAAERLRVRIGQCLVLEDSAVGIEAASRAGALSVLIPSVLPVDAATAGLCNLQVTDLAQLRTVIAGP
jgi:beta-phosphoglucomutase